MMENTPIFSPDSRRVACIAQTGRKWLVAVDGKEEVERYNGIGAGSLTFSPDSECVAYAARTGRKISVVINGKEGKKYDNISLLRGGKIIFDSPDSLHYFALAGDDVYLVEETIGVDTPEDTSEPSSLPFF